ncbi:MAG: thiamine-binding protein, partial [Myxococcales bacterium]|nr:thiamine-binding protein [Myxococcales bacterium]
FAAGAVRVGSVVKIDDRRDREVAMESKVTSVEEKLG